MSYLGDFDDSEEESSYQVHPGIRCLGHDIKPDKKADIKGCEGAVICCQIVLDLSTQMMNPEVSVGSRKTRVWSASNQNQDCPCLLHRVCFYYLFSLV